MLMCSYRAAVATVAAYEYISLSHPLKRHKLRLYDLF